MNRQSIIITEHDLKNIVFNAINKLFNRVPYQDGIHEIADSQEIRHYSKYIWNILQNSYQQLGGFRSYHDANEMAERISLLIIGVRNHQIVACAIYRDDLGGQKLNGCGTLNGKSSQKALLRSIIQDDINNYQKYHWVEVSYPLEKWFKELNGNPIPSSLAHNLLHKSKSKIKELGDGVHYERTVGNNGTVATKAIYGFKNETVYNKVMTNLEKYCGFDDYNDFKSYANNLPKLSEEYYYYEENHPNKEIAQAMEIVIQIGNIWDEGVRELTPNMHSYLTTALNILQNTNVKNTQINSLIKNGKYYLNNMDVLVCHSMQDFLILPAF